MKMAGDSNTMTPGVNGQIYSDWEKWHAVPLFICSACFIAYIVLFAVVSYFAFHDPDPSQCFYMPGLDVPATREDDLISIAASMHIEVKPEYPVDFARIFRLWFTWGFYATLIPVLCVCVFGIFSRIDALEGAMNCLGMCVCCLTPLSIIGWIVVGGLWRFSRPGQIVSGDLI